MSKMDQLAGYGGKGGPTFFDNMTKGALVFGAAIAGPMAMGVRGAVALEDAVVGVGASLGNIDSSTLEDLSDLFLEVGANSKYSATEVAGVADELAKAGFDEVDLLGGMVEQVVMLSQATGEGLAPATAGITQAFSMWSEAVVGSELAMTDATRAADVLTIAANQSAGGITDVISGLTNAGPALAGVGLGFDDAAAAIAYFTNFGYSGSEVGTKLSRTLTQLANPTAEAATLMNDLGISAFDLEGNFIGFPALFDQLQAGFAGMGDEARLASLKILFGAEAFDLMNIATQTGGEGLLEFMGLFDQTGVAAEQSATRMNTVAAKFDALKEGIGSFFTSLVTGLLPGFHLGLDLANAFVDALMRIPDPIKTIIGAFSGLLAIISTISIGASVFGAISTMLGGIGISAGGAATALGAFVTPIAAIGAAAAGLYLIWKNNFLGLGDVFDQALAPVLNFGRRIQTGFQGVENFIGRFTSAFRRVEGPVNAAGDALDTFARPIAAARKGFNALTSMVGKITKPIAVFAKGFSTISEAAYDFLGPLTGIAGAGSRFADTLSRALMPLDKFGRMASSASGAVTSLARVFDALGFAIRGINGGDIPNWLGDIADGFEWAADAVDRFMEAFRLDQALSQLNGQDGIGAFVSALRAGLSTVDFEGATITVANWVMNVALPGLITLGFDMANAVLPHITGFVVSITDWVARLDGAEVALGTLDIAADIASWVADHPVEVAIGAAGLVTLFFFGVPGIVFAGLASLGVMIALMAKDQIPPELTINAALLTINLAYFTVEVIDFATQAALAVAGKVMEPIAIADALGITFQSATVSFAFSFIDLMTVEVINATGAALNIADQILIAFTSASVSFTFDLIDLMTTEAINATGAVVLITDAVLISFTVATVSMTFDLIDLMTKKAVSLIGEAISIGDEITIEFTSAAISFGFDLIDLITQEIVNLLPTSIDIPMPDINLTNPFSGGDDGGLDFSGMGEGIAKSLQLGFERAWLDFATNILPNLIPGGGGGGYELPAASPIDFSAVTGGIEDVKARLAEIGPAIQGAFGVSIDTSAFTGGLESAKASLVDLATTAQMQSLAMAMAGLEMGQAFVTGVQASISAGAGQVAGAITSLMAPASASRAQMALYGINAGLGYGTGVAAGIRSQTGAVAGAAASYLAVVSGYRGAMMAAGIGIGAALGQGIAAGIRSQIGAVAAAAASMVTTAVAAARAAGGIQSPSTVMRDQVGLNLALGTAEGILAGLPAIYSAANRMVYIPDVPNRGFASGGGTIVQTTNNAPTTVNVTVEGSVTGENELLGRFAQEIAERVHRRDVAIGVAQ